MRMVSSFEIPPNQIVTNFDERFVKNGFVTNVFGQIYWLGDLGLGDVVKIQRSHNKPSNTLFILSKASLLSASKQVVIDLGLGTLKSYNRVHKQSQIDMLEDIANNTVDSKRLKDAKDLLPVLFLADLALRDSGIIIRKSFKDVSILTSKQQGSSSNTNDNGIELSATTLDDDEFVLAGARAAID